MFTVLSIIISLALISVILLQVRGGGTALFGQAESSFRVRRGFEKIFGNDAKIAKKGRKMKEIDDIFGKSRS